MKKLLIIFIIIFLLLGCNKKDKVIEDDKTLEVSNLNIIDNLDFEYDSEIYLYDLIVDNNLEIISENTKLDTSKLGNNVVTIKYKSNDRVLEKEITYNIVDTTKPLVLISSSITVDKGTKSNIVNKALCADNYDKRPNCYIEGKYDVNKVGTYDLVYNAIDSSNNKVSYNFKLKVVNPTKSTSKNKPKYKIEDLIKNHKNDNTMIGIDVSSWQGNVDYKKVKNTGVEFVMIRIGFGHNKKGELVMDSKFKNNIKNAKAAGLKVGLYFYSYANTIDKATEQAKWIVKNLDGEKLDLPIAFDWEDWKSFNTYNMSLHDIKEVASAFINEIKKSGYDGMLYSSKYYLEQIWGVNKFDTWLAHYTNETSYKGNYKIWQLSSRGKVSGISGDVDLDILYK